MLWTTDTVRGSDIFKFNCGLVNRIFQMVASLCRCHQKTFCTVVVVLCNSSYIHCDPGYDGLQINKDY